MEKKKKISPLPCSPKCCESVLWHWEWKAPGSGWASPPLTRRKAGPASLRGRLCVPSRAFTSFFPPGCSHVVPFHVLFLAVLVLKPLLSFVTQEAPEISPRPARSQAVLSDVHSHWTVLGRSFAAPGLLPCVGAACLSAGLSSSRTDLPPNPCSVASLLSRDWARWGPLGK